ncbi:MAG: entericidin A/B family lipoprotein [Luteolibacter sp.]
MNTILISRTTKLLTKQLSARALTFAAAAAIFVVAGSSVSCATAHGFGRDVEKVGDEIQHAAH